MQLQVQVQHRWHFDYYCCYSCSCNHSISNEGGEDTEASAVSEWFAVRVELSLSEMISVLKYVYNNYELFY
jgi:hypothetical protein